MFHGWVRSFTGNQYHWHRIAADEVEEVCWSLLHKRTDHEGPVGHPPSHLVLKEGVFPWLTEVKHKT